MGDRMIWRVAWVLFLLGLCVAAALPVQAQEEGLNISESKQFGYNMGSQIQGTFRIRVRGPEDLAVVTDTCVWSNERFLN